jgi:hypothetical protein
VSSRTTADGYIRVSRRAGRERESFISPEVQRKKIADWAALHDVEVVNWWEEIDQFGAKLERPLFQQALARCEAGETGGIIVARLDRFARPRLPCLFLDPLPPRPPWGLALRGRPVDRRACHDWDSPFPTTRSGLDASPPLGKPFAT